MSQAARVLGRATIALDLAVRCGVVVLAALAVRQLWGEPLGPDSDGIPPRLLIAPIAAYAVWNLAVTWVWLRSWAAAEIGLTAIAAVAALSLLRLLWLPGLARRADEIGLPQRGLLPALQAASVICAVVGSAQAAWLLFAERRAGGVSAGEAAGA